MTHSIYSALRARVLRVTFSFIFIFESLNKISRIFSLFSFFNFLMDVYMADYVIVLDLQFIFSSSFREQFLTLL